ncbi:ABC transporter substrate-binding protein [Seleniivibrio woodruffii]|uniref:ABC transporter substrate-binding protein n=1 Tax=Seleniivibrio woodruffii TaxID=1078050 RepID=UPI0039E5C258
MPLVTREMTLSEIISAYPDTRAVFASNGLPLEQTNHLFLTALTVESFMSLRNINPEIFLKLLNDTAEASSEVKILYTDETPVVRTDFLGYVVCPFKHLYKEAFEKKLHGHYDRTGEKLVSFVPMGCGGPDPYEYIWDTENIDELPDAIASIGFGNFWRKDFRERFLDNGKFIAVERPPLQDVFRELEDPLKQYTIYSVSAYVILVDHKKLGDLPVPKTWLDIANPIYKDNVIISGSDDEINEVFLMHIYKDGGEEALKNLAPNIKATWHASQMAKAAGSSMADGAAIYVLAWFFADTCPNTDHISIIFPEDGAMISPMYMMVKADKAERMKPVTDFMTGAEMGAISAGSKFPPLCPEIPNILPEGTGLKWFGWDFVRENDMKVLAEELNARLAKYRRKCGSVNLLKPSPSKKGFKRMMVKG